MGTKKRIAFGATLAPILILSLWLCQFRPTYILDFESSEKGQVVLSTYKGDDRGFAHREYSIWFTDPDFKETKTESTSILISQGSLLIASDGSFAIFQDSQNNKYLYDSRTNRISISKEFPKNIFPLVIKSGYLFGRTAKGECYKVRVETSELYSISQAELDGATESLSQVGPNGRWELQTLVNFRPTINVFDKQNNTSISHPSKSNSYTDLGFLDEETVALSFKHSIQKWNFKTNELSKVSLPVMSPAWAKILAWTLAGLYMIWGIFFLRDMRITDRASDKPNPWRSATIAGLTLFAFPFGILINRVFSLQLHTVDAWEIGLLVSALMSWLGFFAVNMVTGTWKLSSRVIALLLMILLSWAILLFGTHAEDRREIEVIYVIGFAVLAILILSCFWRLFGFRLFGSQAGANSRQFKIDPNLNQFQIKSLMIVTFLTAVLLFIAKQTAAHKVTLQTLVELSLGGLILGAVIFAGIVIGMIRSNSKLYYCSVFLLLLAGLVLAVKIIDRDFLFTVSRELQILFVLLACCLATSVGLSLIIRAYKIGFVRPGKTTKTDS